MKGRNRFLLPSEGQKPALLKEGDRFLTVDELAEILPLGKDTIYQMVSERRIPFRKAGAKTIFLLSEILEWTKKQAEDRDNMPAPFPKRLQTGKGSK